MRIALALLCGIGLSACSPSQSGRLPTGTHEDMFTLLDYSQLGDMRAPACAQVSAQAMLTKKPVDIIFVIDNSGSMTDEIVAVESNINTNFASVMSTSGLDYRVIMVSNFGLSANQSICIRPPLGGNATATCSDSGTPTNTANFFHYDYDVQSTDSLQKLLNTYNLADSHGLAPMGWSQWLRMDSVKMFIEITDDQSDLTAASFDSQLLAKTPKLFGDAMNRNYIFHSIIGLHENTPATKAWLPTDPIQATKCTAVGGADGAVNAGPQYQDLSILTKGLRFPICQKASFNDVFQQVAMGVIGGAQVPCQFKVPDAPSGATVNVDTVVVTYSPSGGGAPQGFTQVANAAACTSSQFYIEGDQIHLCPATCTAVKADAMAKLDITFDCNVPIN